MSLTVVNETNTDEFTAVAFNIPSNAFYDLTRRAGFDTNKANIELLANSLDANADTITIETNEKTIDYIDNGDGISTDIIKSGGLGPLMKNKRNEKTVGESGLGFHAASITLSNSTQCTVYTKSKIDQLMEIIFDFTTRDAYVYRLVKDQKTIDWFDNRVSDTGTIIQLPYTDDNFECIKCNFDIKEWRSTFKKLTDTLASTFGTTPINLYFHNKGDSIKELVKFDPLSLPACMYYNTILHIRIDYFKLKNGIIQSGVLEDNGEYWGFEQKSKTVANAYEPLYNVKKKGTKKIGSADFKCGLIRHDDFFDPKNPKIPDTGFTSTKQRADYLLPYDKQFPDAFNSTCHVK